MIIITTQKATEEQIKQMLEDFESYIKVVIDIENKILGGGGERHFDAEQLLIEQGSKQSNLWGGGIDWETKEIDYNSMINLRPNQNNPSRDILDANIRNIFVDILKQILL